MHTATKSYVLAPGDSLFFDANIAHGPLELRKPAGGLSVDHRDSAPGWVGRFAGHMIRRLKVFTREQGVKYLSLKVDHVSDG